VSLVNIDDYNKNHLTYEIDFHDYKSFIF